MRLGDLFNKAVQEGLAADPRGREAVLAELERAREAFEQLPEKEREFFDREKLENPYADTRILHGDPAVDVRGVLVGVDVEVGEVLLADRLRAAGKQIDLLVAHHPEGRALAQFHEVMYMQADILARMGVPITAAEGLLAERVKEVAHRVLPVNHSRAVDAARSLGIPFLCLHTPADNMVASHLQALFDERRPERLSQVLDILLEIPEYRQAALASAGPTIIAGGKEGRCGRVFVDMTGGTEGSKEIFSRLAGTAVGTIVCMHLSEEHLKEAEKHQIRVVVAGHMASDNLGLNLLLDRVTAGQQLEVHACSGFTRVERQSRS